MGHNHRNFNLLGCLSLATSINFLGCNFSLTPERSVLIRLNRADSLNQHQLVEIDGLRSFRVVNVYKSARDGAGIELILIKGNFSATLSFTNTQEAANILINKVN